MRISCRRHLMPHDESMGFTPNNEKNKQTEKRFLTNQSKDLAKPADLLGLCI